MNNILVPIDLSEVTQPVVSYALQIAGAFNARVWLLHVAQPHPDFTAINLDAGKAWRNVQVASYHQAFKDIAETLVEAGNDVTPVLIQGPVVESIHETARSIQADLIVLGSHGHGALYDLLVGSTSEGVIRHSSIPVTVVPAPQR